jgi:hypothetical protein
LVEESHSSGKNTSEGQTLCSGGSVERFDDNSRLKWSVCEHEVDLEKDVRGESGLGDSGWSGIALTIHLRLETRIDC